MLINDPQSSNAFFADMFSPELLFPFSPEFGFHFLVVFLASVKFLQKWPTAHQNVTLRNRLRATAELLSFQTTEMKIAHFV